MKTLDELMAERPIDPAELGAAVEAFRTRARAARLQELREQQELTQSALAADLGVSQSQVSQIERGNLDSARVNTLRRYVEALGGKLSVEAAFGDSRYVLV
jgi:transcriptional regulator with XRE-family HTH domain